MRIARLAALVLPVLALVSPVAAQQEDPGAPARIAAVEGQVSVETASSESLAAAPNLPLGPGDRLVTAGGRAEVQLPSGGWVRVGDATRVVLQTLPAGSVGSTRIGLEAGTVRVSTGAVDAQNTLTVDLPQASVQPSTPSIFRADVFGDGSVQVVVYSGGVVAQTAFGSVAVEPARTLRVGAGRPPAIYALPAADDFDRWAEARDRALASAPAPPYLPVELAPYAADFAGYGRWVSVSQFGDVWAPSVEAGWSPFRDGRWSWWRGDWVWVAAEPWGWAPFHYGRWLFHGPVGWVWVPPASRRVAWGPGAVAWIGTRDRVAWIPLAPGERFIDRRSRTVTDVRVTNVFVNARVNGAVVAARTESFVRDRRGTAPFVAPRDVSSSATRPAPARRPEPPVETPRRVFQPAPRRAPETARPFPPSATRPAPEVTRPAPRAARPTPPVNLAPAAAVSGGGAPSSRSIHAPANPSRPQPPGAHPPQSRGRTTDMRAR